MGRDAKLARLPSSFRKSKRPLVRPPIASPYANSSQRKVVYISIKTPFVSATKRVRKLLSEIEKRTLDNATLLDQDQGRSDKQKLKALAARPSKPEAVYIRATGRAIEKCLNLALYFQNQQDCRVELKTGTVGTVDDIVEAASSATDPDAPPLPSDDQSHHDMQDESQCHVQSPETTAVPEIQVRKASFLEAAVWLK